MSTFGRITRVNVAGLRITSPPLSIEFDMPFSDSADGNVGMIKVLNLSDQTIARISVGTPIVLEAGYQGDVGTVAVGTVEEATTAWEGIDKITTLVVGDGTSYWLTAWVNQSWRAGVRASEIARDIIGALGLNVGRIQLPNDATYPSGKVFSTSAKAALEEIAADTGAKLHVTRQAVYLVPPGHFEQVGVFLSADTGLLESPQPSTERPEAYRVRMLLQHRITTDSLIEIASRTATGRFRVVSGRHKSSVQEHVTEVLVVPA